MPARASDLLPAFNHGPRADHPKPGDAHDEPQREKSGHKVEQRQDAAQLLGELVGDDDGLKLIPDQQPAEVKPSLVDVNPLIESEVIAGRGEGLQRSADPTG